MLLTACAHGTTGGQAIGADIAILPPATIAEMLHQCSREAPASGTGSWQPTISDIAKLEAALPDALASTNPRGGEDLRNAPTGWRRQYVGIVRDGRRYIYGNFIPKGVVEPSMMNWRREPVRICDGGPTFFGVEYDVANARVTHLAFNGAI
ncbi:hypothetical protein OK349_02570 [Sphingomonas sp. BT-65]|uniref:hypothetical protein n=1 Tax=Sphingomonas sp. BT-65 TaxID=2989821 RepID=UPI002236AA2C|nr:hypothetical protein [Sphingomonas sp. BT-65]MCW4460575.1 hypothetical protein [Sphingomonas sp. BT-65]